MKEKIDENHFLYPRLRYSWDMIHCLWDFIECIKENRDELKDPRNINLMGFMRDFHKDFNFNPAGVLKDYMYLEGNSFFQYAKNLKTQKNDENIPELPNYLKELKRFRNIMVGHRDFKEKVKFPDGWVIEQEKMARILPVARLMEDIDNIYTEILKRQRDSRRTSSLRK